MNYRVLEFEFCFVHALNATESAQIAHFKGGQGRAMEHGLLVKKGLKESIHGISRLLQHTCPLIGQSDGWATLLPLVLT
jgi:hypothetical protein